MATVAVIHSNHYGESILYDGCSICDGLSTHIYDLTDEQLQTLAKLAEIGTRGLSLNESRAITHLRLYQLTVGRSETRD